MLLGSADPASSTQMRCLRIDARYAMPRPPRLIIPGVPVHVIQRGNNRAATFSSATEFQRFRRVLIEESRQFECSIHAYVFMTNHVHLLVTPPSARAVASLMQAVGRRYVRWLNDRRNRSGTLWEGRFKSSLIDSERYLLTCSRYIELNPVRAGMVPSPSRYKWSSHHHNARGENDELVTPHAVYRDLGSSAAKQQAAYRGLFRSAIPSTALDEIRRGNANGGVVGGDAFREWVEALIDRPTVRMTHGGDRRSLAFRCDAQLPSRRSVASTTLTP